MLVVLLVLLLWGHLPTLGAGVRGVEEEQYQCILMGGGGEVEGPKASSRKSCIPHTGLSRFQCCTGRGGGGAFLAWRLLCVVVSCCLLRPSIQLRKRAGGEDVTSKQIELLFHEERGTQARAPRSCDVLIGPQSKQHAWDKWMAFLREPIYLNYGVVSAAQVKEGSGWGGFCPCCDVSFRHAPKPARATAVGSEMGICLRGLRAYYKQQRWQRSCIFFGTPTPQYRPTLSQNNSGPPIRGRPCHALTSSSAIGLQHMVTALNGALKAWGLTLCPKKSRCMVLVRTTTPLASTFEPKARRWTRWENSAILAPLSLRTEGAQLQSTTAPGKPGSDSTKAISFGACAAQHGKRKPPSSDVYDTAHHTFPWM